MVDVDDFKAINDRFGHDVGDDALVAVATAIAGELRRPDVCFRWGGDEFALLLPETRRDSAEVVIVRVSDAVAREAQLPSGGRISVGAGVATLRVGERADELVERADARLLAGEARRRGGQHDIRGGLIIFETMSARFVHTCIRVRDVDASVAFYERLGFEHRGRLNFGSAYNVYLGLPGDGDTLELTVNVGREEPYDLGDGYNHMALVVDDLDALLDRLDDSGVEPEKAAVRAGRPRGRPAICFVQDPDGYRIELIDKAFPTPQDPPTAGVGLTGVDV